MKTKTEQALARIFAHCDAVASGKKPTPSVEDGRKMAMAFLGITTPPSMPRMNLIFEKFPPTTSLPTPRKIITL